MVVHLCLPDSCEENEDSSAHCIKLLIINSSLEIGKLRCYTCLYRRLVWDEAEFFGCAPFPLVLTFRWTWLFRSSRFCMQWWAQSWVEFGEGCKHSWRRYHTLLSQWGLFGSCTATCRELLRGSGKWAASWGKCFLHPNERCGGAVTPPVLGACQLPPCSRGCPCWRGAGCLLMAALMLVASAKDSVP